MDIYNRARAARHIISVVHMIEFCSRERKTTYSIGTNIILGYKDGTTIIYLG